RPAPPTQPLFPSPALPSRPPRCRSLALAFPARTSRIMCAFTVLLIPPAHSPEQPTVVYSLPLQGGCGGPASITGTTPPPSARSSTSQPPVALVAHHHPRIFRTGRPGSSVPSRRQTPSGGIGSPTRAKQPSL